ncbi:MAG: hypothetical protein AAF387_13605 [Pseudomonadota bacterium]
MRIRLAVSAILFWALTLQVAAIERKIVFVDPAGDSATGLTVTGDLVELLFTFDDESGAYDATFYANPGNPFVGTGRIGFDLKLFNERLLPAGAGFGELMNVGTTFLPTVAIPSHTISGTSETLKSWQPGDTIILSHDFDFAPCCGRAEIVVQEPSSGSYSTLDAFPEHLTAIVPAAPANGPPQLITIEFEGELILCSTPDNNCQDTPFSSLSGKSFSGVVTFPNIGEDLQPNNFETGYYVFETDASFTLDVSDVNLNLEAVSPVSVLVLNCIGKVCGYNEDFVFIIFRSEQFEYSFGLGTPRPPWSGDEIPDVERLLNLYANLSICTIDYDDCITIDYISHPSNSPVTYTVKSVSLNPDNVRQIPYVSNSGYIVLGTTLLIAAKRRLTRSTNRKARD